MDEVRIESKFMKMVVAKVVKAVLRNKLGCEVDIRLNGLQATVIDGVTHLHLDVDAELKKEELIKILNDLV